MDENIPAKSRLKCGRCRIRGWGPSNTIPRPWMCNKRDQLPSHRSLLMKLKIIACAMEPAGKARVIDPMHVIVSLKLSVK
jgi:hypothetical protein